MKYKGYTGNIKFDEEGGVFYGMLSGIRDVVHYEGRSAEELTQAFHDSVDDYLETCEQHGREPEKPCSGNLLVRLGPELHRSALEAAESVGESVNTLITQAIERHLHNIESDQITDVQERSH